MNKLNDLTQSAVYTYKVDSNFNKISKSKDISPLHKSMNQSIKNFEDGQNQKQLLSPNNELQNDSKLSHQLLKVISMLEKKIEQQDRDMNYKNEIIQKLESQIIHQNQLIYDLKNEKEQILSHQNYREDQIKGRLKSSIQQNRNIVVEQEEDKKITSILLQKIQDKESSNQSIRNHKIEQIDQIKFLSKQLELSQSTIQEYREEHSKLKQENEMIKQKYWNQELIWNRTISEQEQRIQVISNKYQNEISKQQIEIQHLKEQQKQQDFNNSQEYETEIKKAATVQLKENKDKLIHQPKIVGISVRNTQNSYINNLSRMSSAAAGLLSAKFDFTSLQGYSNNVVTPKQQPN